MASGIFGIFGHILMPNAGPMMWLFAAVFALAGFAVIVRWRPSETTRLPLYLMVIAAFYGLFLMYVVNYRAYLDSGLPTGAAGTLHIPGSRPDLIVFCYYLMRLFRSEYARLVVAIAVSILFIASDLPFFLLHVTPDWFGPLFRY